MFTFTSFFPHFGLLMICLHQFSGPVNGLPYQLNFNKVFESVGELRTKKDALTSFAPVDDDVVELEHLKSFPIDTASMGTYNKNSDSASSASEAISSISISDEIKSHPVEADAGDGENADAQSAVKSVFDSAVDVPTDDQSQLDNLPLLEKQLEAEAHKDKAQTTATSQPEREEEMIVQQMPNGPHAAVPETPQLNAPTSDEIVPPAPAKSYHGAARLAFGQHPEILPTTTSTTTTTTQSHEFGSADAADAHATEHDDSSSVLGVLKSLLAETSVHSPAEVPSASDPSIIAASTTHSTPSSTTTTTTVKPIQNQPAHPGHTNSETRTASATFPAPTSNPIATEKPAEVVVDEHKTQLVPVEETTSTQDDVVAELEANKANVKRRSVKRTPPKSAESLLRNSESSFDMAQYVFWTGDEAGVARAVEEFIQQGLMSRESALNFLKEIRMGIEYLEKSYANRVVPDQKKRDPTPGIIIPLMVDEDKAERSSGSMMDVPTLGNQYSIQHHNRLEQQWQKQNQFEQQQIDQQPKSLNLQRTLDHLPSLIRLQEATTSNSHSAKDNADYDEITGRAKIAEFLYAEYSLEEVIYQLAKVMFSQSLTHGSEQSQRALQRLTNFLEREGEQGVISPALQKKILDVLLAALSDTLSDHPELLATARAKLGRTFLTSESALESLRH